MLRAMSDVVRTVAAIRVAVSSRLDLLFEILALRHQVTVLARAHQEAVLGVEDGGLVGGVVQALLAALALEAEEERRLEAEQLGAKVQEIQKRQREGGPGQPGQPGQKPGQKPGK